MDPDQDLDFLDEDEGDDEGFLRESGDLPLSPRRRRQRLTELLAEGHDELPPPPLVPVGLPTIPMRRTARAQAADALESFGCWCGRGWWSLVARIRGVR